jgi:hypothetical protein
MLVLLVRPFAPGVASAGDTVVVHAEGAAIRTDEVPDVKKAALDQALKNAVAEALESVIEREHVKVDPSIIETSIYSNAVDFVVNFKIITEERKTELVMPPLPEPAPVTAGEEGADIEHGAEPAGGGARAEGAVEPVEEGAEPEEIEPVVVETYFVWIEASIDTVSLSDALGKIVLEEERISGTLTLVLLDIVDYETYTAIMEALGRIAMLHDITYGSFYPGRFTMSARPAADIRSLVKSISTTAGPDFIVVKGGPRTIIIKAYPKTIELGE